LRPHVREEKIARSLIRECRPRSIAHHRQRLESLADLVDRQIGGVAPNLILTSAYLARG